MSDVECMREDEILELVAAGRWPDLARTELAAHAASCGICGDLMAVAVALRDDSDRARAEARVPSAGLVWWRAQLRTRQRGAEAASRPMTYAHAAGAVVAGVLLFTLGGLLWPWLRASVGWIEGFSQAADVGRLWVPLVLAFGVWLVLGPVLLLVALSDD